MSRAGQLLEFTLMDQVKTIARNPGRSSNPTLKGLRDRIAKTSSQLKQSVISKPKPKSNVADTVHKAAENPSQIKHAAIGAAGTALGAGALALAARRRRKRMEKQRKG